MISLVTVRIVRINMAGGSIKSTHLGFHRLLRSWGAIMKIVYQVAVLLLQKFFGFTQRRYDQVDLLTIWSLIKFAATTLVFRYSLDDFFFKLSALI